MIFLGVFLSGVGSSRIRTYRPRRSPDASTNIAAMKTKGLRSGLIRPPRRTTVQPMKSSSVSSCDQSCVVAGQKNGPDDWQNIGTKNSSKWELGATNALLPVEFCPFDN